MGRKDKNMKATHMCRPKYNPNINIRSEEESHEKEDTH
jgi:hypothetical protein